MPSDDGPRVITSGRQTSFFSVCKQKGTSHGRRIQK